MYRFETRYFIIFFLILTWTIPIYLLVKYSINNKALTKTNLQLERLILDLRQDLEDLKVKKPNPLSELSSSGNLPPAKTQDVFKTWTPKFLKQRNNNNRNTNVKLNYENVKRLPESKRKRILITGGAGFVGSHLVDSLMLDGHEVIVCDNFFTGRKYNIEHWQGHANFELLNHDIINPLTIEVNEIYHLASPASPIHYMSNPIKTIKTNTIGTINMLGLAKRVNAKILVASTSEIYGDPKEHPQVESYWGHTNPIGPRSCYDESKRISETLAYAYNSRENVSIAIARIFNTYGPRMHPNDGRVVSNLINQALNNEPMTIYGDGKQTRSFQYVTDLIEGLKKLMGHESGDSQLGPVNLGNPQELTIHSLALEIKKLLPQSTSEIEFKKLPIDDPQRRRPDITKAIRKLNWKPSVSLHDGLIRTIEYFNQDLES